MHWSRISKKLFKVSAIGAKPSYEVGEGGRGANGTHRTVLAQPGGKLFSQKKGPGVPEAECGPEAHGGRLCKWFYYPSPKGVEGRKDRADLVGGWAETPGSGGGYPALQLQPPVVHWPDL